MHLYIYADNAVYKNFKAKNERKRNRPSLKPFRIFLLVKKKLQVSAVVNWQLISNQSRVPFLALPIL